MVDCIGKKTFWWLGYPFFPPESEESTSDRKKTLETLKPEGQSSVQHLYHKYSRAAECQSRIARKALTLFCSYISKTRQR